MQWLIFTPKLMSFKVLLLAVSLPYVPPLSDFIHGCNNLKSISSPNQLDYYFQLLLPIDAIPAPQILSKPCFFFYVPGQSKQIHCSSTHKT